MAQFNTLKGKPMKIKYIFYMKRKDKNGFKFTDHESIKYNAWRVRDSIKSIIKYAESKYKNDEIILVSLG